MTTRQDMILRHVREHGCITLLEATLLTGAGLYANAERHVGASLARMVRRGLLARVRRGVFGLLNTEVCGERSSPVPDHNAGHARSQ
jgi:hypothetical protein